MYIEYLLTSTYYSSSQPTVANTQIPWYEVYIVEGNTGTNFTNFSDKFYEIIKEWCSLRIDRAMSDFFLKGGCAGRPSLKHWHLVESCIMWGSEDQKKKAEDKQACKSREQGVHVVGTARTPSCLKMKKGEKLSKMVLRVLRELGIERSPGRVQSEELFGIRRKQQRSILLIKQKPGECGVLEAK